MTIAYPPDQTIVVPIAIRPDVTVKILIPADLTKAEAEKIANVVKAMVPPRSP